MAAARKRSGPAGMPLIAALVLAAMLQSVHGIAQARAFTGCVLCEIGGVTVCQGGGGYCVPTRHGAAAQCDAYALLVVAACVGIPFMWLWGHAGHEVQRVVLGCLVVCRHDDDDHKKSKRHKRDRSRERSKDKDRSRGRSRDKERSRERSKDRSKDRKRGRWVLCAEPALLCDGVNF